MKPKIVFLSLICLLLMLTGCVEPDICADCVPFTFKQTYLTNFKNDEIFFIKGVTLDVNKNGREIKVIEDLKGNFTDKSTIFVWGGTGKSCGKPPLDLRGDFITQYHKYDTLIMFIEKVGNAPKRPNKYVEKSSDYTTLTCYPSVLKLSNGYVTRGINYWGVPVPWKELQEELQMLLNSDEKPFWWNSENFIPDAFIIAYKGIYNLKDRQDIPDFYKNYFFIQGLVLESYGDYGKKIQIITDLNGTFPKETTTFTVWGNSGDLRYNDRFDNLKLYNNQDTLLMLLRSVSKGEETMFGNIEKTGDYTTLYGTFSVLKLLDNIVSGYITSCYKGEETMSWTEFQELLNLTK